MSNMATYRCRERRLRVDAFDRVDLMGGDTLGDLNLLDCTFRVMAR